MLLSGVLLEHQDFLKSSGLAARVETHWASVYLVKWRRYLLKCGPDAADE